MDTQVSKLASGILWWKARPLEKEDRVAIPTLGLDQIKCAESSLPSIYV